MAGGGTGVTGSWRLAGGLACDERACQEAAGLSAAGKGL